MFSKSTAAVLAIVILALAGCATALGPMFEPAPVGKTGEGTLYVYSGDRVKVYTPTIHIDDKPYAGLERDGYFWVHVPAGKHEVLVDWPLISAQPSARLTVEVADGRNSYLRVSDSADLLSVSTKAFSMKHSTMIYEVEESAARTELGTRRLILKSE
jgi:hypothetical protein